MRPSPPPAQLVLLGQPVAHSLSPRMQNAALAAAGLDLRYEALEVSPDQLGTVLESLRERDAAGNVTIPHKRAVMAACGWLSDDAARAGAVNTFWWSNGTLCGDNTDVAGFDLAARAVLGSSALPPFEARVALLGAGGAAAAVLLALSRWPRVGVRIGSRSPARAEALARAHPEFAQPVAEMASAVTAGTTLVVNATPIGLDGRSQPMDVRLLPPGAAVLDLVYREDETPWVLAARSAGYRAADGLRMLVEQGALAFERWMGMAPDRAAMWSAIGRPRR